MRSTSQPCIRCMIPTALPELATKTSEDKLTQTAVREGQESHRTGNGVCPMETSDEVGPGEWNPIMEQKHTARRLGWHMHSFGTSFCWVAMSTVSTRNSPEHSPYVTVGESSQSTFLSITSCIFHIRSSGTSLTHVRVQHRSLATHMHAFSKRGPAHWPCRTVWLIYEIFLVGNSRPFL